MKIKEILKMMTPPVVLQVYHKLKRDVHHLGVEKKLEGQKKIHLACGNNVLDGWANIDLYNKGPVIGYDLTRGLPVRSGTVELIYCEHFLEHLTLQQATELLTECHRVLRPDGVMRVSGPRMH